MAQYCAFDVAVLNWESLCPIMMSTCCGDGSDFSLNFPPSYMQQRQRETANETYSEYMGISGGSRGGGGGGGGHRGHVPPPFGQPRPFCPYLASPIYACGSHARAGAGRREL